MKNTFDYFRYLLLFVAVCAFAACSDDDENGNGGDANGSIEIAEDMKAIACVGTGNDSKTITFTAKNDWTAIVSHSWIDLNKRSGNAGENQSLIVTIEDNDEFKTRIGTVTIKDKVSGNSVDITITQGEKGSIFTIAGTNGGDKSQGGTLIINSEKLVISDTIHVVSNYEYTVKSDVEWLQPEKVGKNADGSVKYVFHADPAKLYAATGYKEKVATISFAYQADTRAPGTQEYLVKFAGITPTLKSDVEPAIMEDSEEGYRAVLHITSNIKWELKSTTLPFATVEYPSGGTSSDGEVTKGVNNSVHYFETVNTVICTYNKDALQVEEESGTLNFVDAENKDLANTITVTYPGVGNDYVVLDRASFKLNSDYLCVFEAGAEYTNETLNFKVTSSLAESDIAYYIVRQKQAAGEIFKEETIIDPEYPDEPEILSNNVGESMTGWGSVYDLELETVDTRTVTPVKTYEKELSIKARGNEYNMMGGTALSIETEPRYFAFFAVSSKKYPSYDDLFDEEGKLKPELQDQQINCMQKALGTFEDFKCEGLNNTVINFTATETSKTFNYSGIDLETGSQKWGLGTLFGDNEVSSDGKLVKDPWDDELTTTCEWIEMPEVTELVEGTGTITIKVKANTTGEAREEKVILYVGGDGNGNDYKKVFVQFTIKQAAE